jgi:hypothetical protein
VKKELKKLYQEFQKKEEEKKLREKTIVEGAKLVFEMWMLKLGKSKTHKTKKQQMSDNKRG